MVTISYKWGLRCFGCYKIVENGSLNSETQKTKCKNEIRFWPTICKGWFTIRRKRSRRCAMRLLASSREASWRVHPVHKYACDTTNSIKSWTSHSVRTSIKTGNKREMKLHNSSDNDDDLDEPILLYTRSKGFKRRKKLWVRPIFCSRKEQGEYYNLFPEMRLSDSLSHNFAI